MRNQMREARFRAGKPQAQLWLETGIHYSTISRIERGYQHPSKEQKEVLAEALGVKQTWLFPGDKNEDKLLEVQQTEKI